MLETSNYCTATILTRRAFCAQQWLWVTKHGKVSAPKMNAVMRSFQTAHTDKHCMNAARNLLKYVLFASEASAYLRDFLTDVDVPQAVLNSKSIYNQNVSLEIILKSTEKHKNMPTCIDVAGQCKVPVMLGTNNRLNFVIFLLL